VIRPTAEELTYAHSVHAPDMPGIYYRPVRAVNPVEVAGDFFDVFPSPRGSHLLATLLPWSAPLDGNQYPSGPSGQAGVGFLASELRGPWYPLSLVLKGSTP